MDTRNALATTDVPVVSHVEFNRSYSHFAAALDNGFAIFNSDSCELYMKQETDLPQRRVGMLEETQLVGLVSASSDSRRNARKLSVWDTSLRHEVACITIGTPIVRATLNQTHILVVSERAVHVYKHQPRLEKLATYETHLNVRGLCCLATTLAAFPGRTAGQIQIINLSEMRVSIVPAHSSPLKALDLSPHQELIASASEKGTIIRVHSTSTCARLAELRRGVGNANIFSVVISPGNSRLAVTSDTNTLHIFDLPYILERREGSRQDGSVDGSWETVERSAASAPLGRFNSQKWGNLAKIPFAPRVLTDLYSFASTTFDPGSNDSDRASLLESSTFGALSSDSGNHPQGVVGWINDSTIIVVGAGSDARYERFELLPRNDGRTACVRVAWSKYMLPS